MKTTLLSNLKKSLFLLVPLMVATTSARAITLASLLNGATITSGNLEFFNFHNATQSSSEAALNTAGFAHINVISIGGAGTDFGIRFQSDLWSLGGPKQDYDLGLEFTVRTLSGAPLITGNILSFAGDVGATGFGVTDIVEGVQDAAGNTLATKMAFMEGNDSQLAARLLDQRFFPRGPYAEIEISKDFAMATYDETGSAVSVQHFDQTFSQVPEGGPGLLGTFSVLAALCWAGRGQFKKSVG